MIEYHFAPPELPTLDALETEVVLLPYFEDERPLEGAAGLIDWRLCGALSKRIAADEESGHFGEQRWTVTVPKLRAERLLLFGLGATDGFDRCRAEAACVSIGRSLTDAKLRTAALPLPGRSMDRLSVKEAMQAWVHAIPQELDIDEIVVIEARSEHGVLRSVIDGLRRQAESPLS